MKNKKIHKWKKNEKYFTNYGVSAIILTCWLDITTSSKFIMDFLLSLLLAAIPPFLSGGSLLLWSGNLEAAPVETLLAVTVDGMLAMSWIGEFSDEDANDFWLRAFEGDSKPYDRNMLTI